MADSACSGRTGHSIRGAGRVIPRVRKFQGITASSSAFARQSQRGRCGSNERIASGFHSGGEIAERSSYMIKYLMTTGGEGAYA